MAVFCFMGPGWLKQSLHSFIYSYAVGGGKVKGRAGGVKGNALLEQIGPPPPHTHTVVVMHCGVWVCVCVCV